MYHLLKSCHMTNRAILSDFFFDILCSISWSIEKLLNLLKVSLLVTTKRMLIGYTIQRPTEKASD